MAERISAEPAWKNLDRLSRRALLQRCVSCFGLITLPDAWRKCWGMPDPLHLARTSTPAAGDHSTPGEGAFFDPVGAIRYDRWELLGPGGGGGIILPTVSPRNTKDVLVAGDMTACFISHDGGSSWRMFNLGDRGWFFVFDSVNPHVIYAKTAPVPSPLQPERPFSSPALFRSADAGKTWEKVYADSSYGRLTSLAVDPTDSGTLYGAFQNDQTTVLRVSHDLGRIWEKVADLPGGAVNIFIDPRSSRKNRTLYVIGTNSVAVREGGQWRSGQALRGVESFRDRPDLNRRVASAGFPADGGKLVVYMIAAGRLHISDDGGKSWRESPLSAPSSHLAAVAVATSLWHPDVAYISYNNHRRGKDILFGTAKTTNRGRTWQLVWKESITSAPNIHDPWLSEVYGPGWGGNPIQLGVAPTKPGLCFGGDYGRLMRTTDGGRTWDSVYSRKLPDGTYASTGLDVTCAHTIQFDPFDLKRAFVCYDDIGLWRSENGGKSWSISADGVPPSWINTTYWLAFDPKVRGRVWGVMSNVHSLPHKKEILMSPRGIERASGGVCRSEDGGKTWTRSNNGMPPMAATHVLLEPWSPVKARVLYVTGFARGVFKSTDGGETWTLKNEGIKEENPFAWRLAQDLSGVLYLVVIRRNDDGSIGGRGDGALYRSTDGAEHWTRMKLPVNVNGPHGLEIDRSDPRRLYLAAWARHPDARSTVGGGIYLSTDGGGTWRHVLTQDQYIHDITGDSRDPKVVYACGFDSSAWRSGDHGESWEQIKGYDFKWGCRVIPDPIDSKMIYVATFGSSVWHGPAEAESGAMLRPLKGGFEA